MIFHFAEHSPAAVHAASLRGIAAIFGLGPGYISVFARRIDGKITYDQGVLAASGINVADAAGGDRRAQSDLVFAGGAHLEAHKTIAHGEFVGRRIYQTKINSWLGSGVRWDEQFPLMRHLRKTPQDNQWRVFRICFDDL